jgi:hypothetical protein
MKRSRLSRKGSKARPSRLKKPFDYGEDVRGDIALFLPVKARLDDPSLIKKLKEMTPPVRYEMGEHGLKEVTGGDMFFFRLIDERGKQLHSHGWIRFSKETGSAEIVQWG